MRLRLYRGSGSPATRHAVSASGRIIAMRSARVVLGDRSSAGWFLMLTRRTGQRRRARARRAAALLMRRLYHAVARR